MIHIIDSLQLSPMFIINIDGTIDHWWTHNHRSLMSIYNPSLINYSVLETQNKNWNSKMPLEYISNSVSFCKLFSLEIKLYSLTGTDDQLSLSFASTAPEPIYSTTSLATVNVT